MVREYFGSEFPDGAQMSGRLQLSLGEVGNHGQSLMQTANR
jgi:hypothetical protein